MKIIVIFCGLLLPLTLQAHKKLYLVSTPRSLSTAFVRMMQARQDMAIFNEPAQRAWLDKDAVTENWYREGTPTTHKEVVDLLLAKAELMPVFAKDQSFIVQSLIENDDRLLNDPEVTFIFLLRNPHHSIISFYRKWGKIVDGFSDLTGYKSAYELFVLLKQKTVKNPCIIITEELYNNPQETVAKFCQHVGIPYLEHALHWQDLGDQFDGTMEWNEIKQHHLTHHWHGDAIHSTGFGKPATYATDERGQPTFEEITNSDDRKTCIVAYEENMYYYNAILRCIKS